MLDLARNVSESTIDYRSDVQPPQRPGRQLRGRTAGIIGYGAIGSYLADLLRGIGMRVLVCDPVADPTLDGFEHMTLHDLLAQAEFVLPLAPATPDDRQPHRRRRACRDATGHDARQRVAWRAARRGRGRRGARLGPSRWAWRWMSVGLPISDRPRISPDRPGVVATPHLGGLTPENADAQALSSVEQVRAMLAGDDASPHGQRRTRESTPCMVGRTAVSDATFPAGACDTHMHIYDSRYPVAPIVPAAATRRNGRCSIGRSKQRSASSGSWSCSRRRTGSTTRAARRRCSSSAAMRRAIVVVDDAMTDPDLEQTDPSRCSRGPLPHAARRRRAVGDDAHGRRTNRSVTGGTSSSR